MNDDKVVSLTGVKVLAPAETAPGVRERIAFITKDLDERVYRAIAIVAIDDQQRVTTCLSWEAGFALALLGGVAHISGRLDKQFSEDFVGDDINHKD